MNYLIKRHITWQYHESDRRNRTHKKENVTRRLQWIEKDNGGTVDRRAILTGSVPNGFLRAPAEQYESFYQKAQPGPSADSAYWLHDMLR